MRSFFLFMYVDLHTNNSMVCHREADGEEVFETLSLSSADMERFRLSLDADDEVAVEVIGKTAPGSAIRCCPA